jgi:hypothetical protein|tara:strand:+ start:3148 stop:3549 length:402 start_codon:yes stop_codon:yes gene_type:complete
MPTVYSYKVGEWRKKIDREISDIKQKLEFITLKQTNKEESEMTHISIQKEAEEYFSHNPSEKVVGFAMLDAVQISQANEGDEITGDIMVIHVEVNPDVKLVVHQEYTRKERVNPLEAGDESWDEKIKRMRAVK